MSTYPEYQGLAWRIPHTELASRGGLLSFMSVIVFSFRADGRRSAFRGKECLEILLQARVMLCFATACGAGVLSLEDTLSFCQPTSILSCVVDLKYLRNNLESINVFNVKKYDLFTGYNSHINIIPPIALEKCENWFLLRLLFCAHL